jgi:hypothetical protein
MLRIVSLVALLVITIFIFACGSAPVSNSNVTVNIASNNANIANIPPEFSTSPVPPSANITPGIPANGVNTVPKGATPTPGIPDPKLANLKLKPGATPTPGIPDQETLRRQMQGLEQPNVNGLAPPGGGMMMKKKPQPVNKPQ